MGHGHGADHGMISDWHSVSKPPILWFNTALLVLSSAAMQMARRAVRLNQRARVRGYLFAGGAFALMFLAGQLVAWHQLRDSGSGLTSGPASAFFYVLTGVHGLHLLGGLGVWLKTVIRMRTRAMELIERALEHRAVHGVLALSAPRVAGDVRFVIVYLGSRISRMAQDASITGQPAAA